MQTYTHFLTTAWAGDRLRARAPEPWRPAMAPLLAGSVAPDLPLILLTAWYAGARSRLGTAGEPFFGATYDRFYFEDPLWIVATSLFHAPLVLLGLAAAGAWAARRGRAWGRMVVWFAVGCAFHTLLDVFTHRADGPLLLFPLEVTYRFQAPVSYWDPAHGGRVVGAMEHLVDFGILGYFGLRLLRRRRRPAVSGPPTREARADPDLSA